MMMLTGAERKLDLLTKIFQKLCMNSEKGVPIVVEGKKDLAALRKLGVNGSVICVKSSGKVLVDLLDNVRSDEVALFVDFDNSGVSLAKDITQYLEGRGVKVNSVLWRKARSLVRRDVCEVEGFPTYLEKLKKRVDHS
ncbi:MAG: toprim domain-containing protein [Candidatus Bathyarchaeota archaeon]